VPDERPLSEVVTWLVVLHSQWRFSWLESLGSDTVSLNDHVERASLLISLFNDVFSCFEPLFFESICHLSPLVLLHCLQNAHLLQKVIILFSFNLDCPFDDMIESVSVQAPKLASG